MKRILLMALAVLLLFSAMPVYAAEAITPARQNANYMMSTAADGAPNWFNGTYYSSLYPDLQQAFGTNEAALYQHAMTHGFKEGRMVLPILDVAKYRAFYPDLDAAFGDSWGRYVRHYFEYGILEGRANFTGFDPVAYLELYPDLRAAFGADLSLAARHYLEHGMTEGRVASRPVVVEKPSRPSGPPLRPGPDGEPFSGIIDERDSNGTGYMVTYVNGNIVKNEWYEAGVCMHMVTFDEEGRVIETVYYNPDGSVSHRYVNEYSADGRHVTTRMYIDGVYVGRVEEDYDEQGRRITYYYYGFDSAAGTEVLDYYTFYKYEHPAGGLSEATLYHADGTRDHVEKYDTDGRHVARYDYSNENGTETLLEYTYYEYAFSGDAYYTVSKESCYRPDGTLKIAWYKDETGATTREEQYDEAGNLTHVFDGSGNPLPLP